MNGKQDVPVVTTQLFVFGNNANFVASYFILKISVRKSVNFKAESKLGIEFSGKEGAYECHPFLQYLIL